MIPDDGGSSGPFEHYPVSGGSIRSAAEQTRGRVPAIHTIRTQVSGYARAALGAVEGQLQTTVADAPTQATSHADDVTQKATYAAGAVELFAGFVDDFDVDSSDPRSVSKLNQAYSSASANDFGVAAVTCPHGADSGERQSLDTRHSTDVSAARTALLGDLRAEYGRLENKLDTNAQHVSAMLDRGPNAEDLRTMYGAGALPSFVSLIFPDVSFAGVRIAELPIDLRDLPPDELATWLIDHDDAPQDVVDFALKDTAIADEVGQQLADQVDDRTMGSQELWDDLARFDLNTDVGGAFVAALGAQDFADLMAGRSLTPDGDDLDETSEDEMQRRLVTLGYLMAGASRDGAITRDFLESFDAQYDAGMNMGAMAALMAYGSWDKDTLKTIGDVALHGPTTDMSFSEGRSEILKGISYNPIAAAEFFHENLDEISYMTDGDGLYQYEDSWEQNIADFVHSATIDADGEYQRLSLDHPGTVNLAQGNTKDLMEWLADDNHDDVHMSAETQAVYGQIAEHYVGDLKASVTSPVPSYFDRDDPNRDGIEANDHLWSTLVQEAMRNPDTAADLSIEFKNEVLEDLDQSHRQVGPEHSNGLTNAQAGQLENWFVDNFNETKSEVQDEVDDYNERVDNGISKGLDYVMATGESAASGNPAPLLKQLGKDGAELLLGGLLHHDAPTYDVDTDWANNFSADWQDTAEDKYETGQVKPVTVDDITWDGDPAFYEDLYKGDFTNADGSIMNVNQMDQDGRRAYNEWLQDPAVQNATYGDWSENQVGGVPNAHS